MNISIIKITRSGSSNDTDIINIRLYNDTNLNGVFDLTSDSQIATAQNSTTAGQYVFAGINFNITTSAHSLFVVVNTSGNAVGKTFRFNINGTGDVNTIGSGSAFNITETLTTAEGSQVLIFGRLSVTGVSLVGGQGSDAPECAVNTKRCLPSNEANVALVRLNFTATGEGVNISVIKIIRAAASGLTDDHIVNVRLMNDTNGNGAFDSGTDTQMGSALDSTVSNVYSFAGFQYNVSTSGVNTLFVVVNTTARLGWDPPVYFNLTLNATADINSISATSNENITETITQTHSNTTKITYKGWYNITKHETAPLTPGWNSFDMPIESDIIGTGRNASATGNFNVSSILSSLGSNWRYMRYNINGSSTGWVLADRTDPGGSTLQFVNNTNVNPYWINMTATDRFEL
ncbi:MAG: hypothetical protein HYU56_00520 [Candidatus Aenigmarchaeota archaeon]|nr:hypothetical protein [Candidatus Aenigmarchaeota archaeon]